MFPEHRELLNELRNTDPHFKKLFEKHNELDHKIKNQESQITLASHTEIEIMKKEKLLLKDKIYSLLLKAKQA